MPQLPDKFLQNSISLAHMRISDIAFEKENIPEILEYLIKNNIAILGGDVLDKKSGEYWYNYDNWFLNKSPSESWEKYVLNSIEHTRKYINNYPLTAVAFSLVISEKKNHSSE